MLKKCSFDIFKAFQEVIECAESESELRICLFRTPNPISTKSDMGQKSEISNFMSNRTQLFDWYQNYYVSTSLD